MQMRADRRVCPSGASTCNLGTWCSIGYIGRAVIACRLSGPQGAPLCMHDAGLHVQGALSPPRVVIGHAKAHSCLTPRFVWMHTHLFLWLQGDEGWWRAPFWCSRPAPTAALFPWCGSGCGFRACKLLGFVELLQSRQQFCWAQPRRQ